MIQCILLVMILAVVWSIFESQKELWSTPKTRDPRGPAPKQWQPRRCRSRR